MNCSPPYENNAIVESSSPLRVIERRSAPLKFDDKVLPMFQLRDTDELTELNSASTQQSPRRNQPRPRVPQNQNNQSFTTSYLSLSFFNDEEDQEELKAPLDKVALRAVHDARSLLDSFRKSTPMFIPNDSTASIFIEDF